jgi:hypothetical protein
MIESMRGMLSWVSEMETKDAVAFLGSNVVKECVSLWSSSPFFDQ